MGCSLGGGFLRMLLLLLRMFAADAYAAYAAYAAAVVASSCACIHVRVPFFVFLTDMSATRTRDHATVSHGDRGAHNKAKSKPDVLARTLFSLNVRVGTTPA